MPDIFMNLGDCGGGGGGGGGNEKGKSAENKKFE
jgi:hypothetical protein